MLEYIHKDRKYYVNFDKDNRKQLVQMNPDNMVNYKLTLNLKDMNKYDNLEKDLISIIK